MKAPLFIRADGSARIGSGHVMRALALAQAWRDKGGDVALAHAEITPALQARLASEGVEAVAVPAARGSDDDASHAIAQARARGATWIVADGYCFDAAWQRRVREAGLRLLVVDDYGHAERYHADVILNQNASADPALYARRDPDTRLLLGPRHALLRREFGAGSPRTIADSARKVLVTLGGSDPDNATARVIAALNQVSGVEAVVLVGGSNPHREQLRALVDPAHPAIRLEVDATDMPGLMAWADVAITAAGSTSWEIACLGLPALQLVVADNQREIATALERAGATVNLGDSASAETIARRLRELLADAPRRKAMSEAAAKLVDGHGARRVAAALGAPLQIAIASDADSWFNDHLGELQREFASAGHRVRVVRDPKEIEAGDIAFLLSLGRIVSAEVLRRNAHNLVVHASALPAGRGWSPLTWQILEGKNEIPLTLFEAAPGVDTGEIYAQDRMTFTGGELVGEMRATMAAATLKLCRDFVAGYPFALERARAQEGEPSYYGRRRAADSRLDPDKTLREQFNLLRTCDPDRYPAFFELAGRRYAVRVTPLS